MPTSRKDYVYIATVVGLTLMASLSLTVLEHEMELLKPIAGYAYLVLCVPLFLVVRALGLDRMLFLPPLFVLYFLYFSIGLLPLLGALYFKKKVAVTSCIGLQIIVVILHLWLCSHLWFP